jgi:Domain of unknown function (DUF1877)
MHCSPLVLIGSGDSDSKVAGKSSFRRDLRRDSTGCGSVEAQAADRLARNVAEPSVRCDRPRHQQDLPPLAHAVFGSQPLMEGEDSATFAGYLPAAEVPTVAASLREVERGWLRERFDALSRTDYTAYGGPLDDDRFEVVWACLEGLRDFYVHLVDHQAAMVFSVDC